MTKSINTDLFTTFSTYTITENSTGKVIYVGSTKKSVSHRLNIHFYNQRTAISKYIRSNGGKNAFTIDAIGEFNTRSEAEAFEGEMVASYNTYNNGFNGTANGKTSRTTGDFAKKGRTRNVIVNGEIMALTTGIYKQSHKASRDSLRVCFEIQGKYECLGYFKTLSEAQAVYNKALKLMLDENVTVDMVKQLIK